MSEPQRGTAATASQTVGPYFSIGLSRMNAVALCAETAPGEHIEISGQVLDGNGLPVPDAQLELWQPDHQGNFAATDAGATAGPAAQFLGFARIPTDEQGTFRFHTIVPGAVPHLDGTPQAPHIVVLLSMRGLLKHLFTRIYFNANQANEADPVLLALPAARRATLYARTHSRNPKHFLWNIHLQGENETVFFHY